LSDVRVVTLLTHSRMQYYKFITQQKILMEDTSKHVGSQALDISDGIGRVIKKNIVVNIAEMISVLHSRLDVTGSCFNLCC
jgi:hypothetical protein